MYYTLAKAVGRDRGCKLFNEIPHRGGGLGDLVDKFVDPASIDHSAVHKHPGGLGRAFNEICLLVQMLVDQRLRAFDVRGGLRHELFDGIVHLDSLRRTCGGGG